MPLPDVLSLRGDNFTDPRRTPWGGDRVASWKRALGIDAQAPLGESWEVSFGPELPGMVTGPGTPRPLLDVVADDPVGYLGDEASLGASRILLKLLDAREPLSVQIHPTDDDPGSAPDASGKPECWWVAAADPGAAILFGLADHVTEADLRRALIGGGDVAAMLERFEVRAGDFFVVPPGTPHAIGAGVTVVEPQRVTPGKRGITYRYWDHDRRYDAQGRLDPRGAPRPLHVEDALRVTDWAAARGSLLRARSFRHVADRDGDRPIELVPLSGRGDGAIDFPVEVSLLRGTGGWTRPRSAVGQALIVVEGELAVDGTVARRAQSLFLPAGRDLDLTGRGVVALIASTPRDFS